MRVSEWIDGAGRWTDDYIASEEPLEIHINGEVFGVTLRTPGNDPELVAGFLFSEGIVSDREQLLSVTALGESPNGSDNVIVAYVTNPANLASERPNRRFTAGSACGACGKAVIAELKNRGLTRPENQSRFDAKLLYRLPESLRAAQANFNRTGGIHAAALFSAGGELLTIREDIGRHNAVDKVIGWALNEGRIPLSNHILLVSGRGGFEIIQKAIVAGVPVVASVSAPSSLAVQLAREFGLTLVGFLRGNRFVVYSGENRLEGASTAQMDGK